MINPTAEIIHNQDHDHNSSNNDITNLAFSKVEKENSEKKENTRHKGSSISRRLLPSTPSFLKPNNNKICKSSEDITKKHDKNDTLVSKYKYNSLPRRKEERKTSSSTFYVDNEETKINVSNLDTLPNKQSDTATKLKAIGSNSNSPKTKRKETKVDSPRLKSKESDYNKETEIKELTTENNKQTHVALYKFYPRHKDELSFLDGDPIQVLKMFDDLWYEGINLSTQKQGFFPCRYVADIMAQEISSTIDTDFDHKQFHMRFLGSVEVSDYKGDEVLCFAIAKVVNQRSMLSTSNPPSCVLQVNTKGIRIADLQHFQPDNRDADRKLKKGKQIENIETEETVSHFFSLKNVTFCGNHPKDRRYFGFITKHPDEHRFACHIFMSKYSTDHVARIIGDCFQKFYTSYMEYRAPTEDIYLE